MKITLEVNLSRQQMDDALDRLIDLVKEHAPDPAQDFLAARHDNVVFLLNAMTGYQFADEERVRWLMNK